MNRAIARTGTTLVLALMLFGLTSAFNTASAHPRAGTGLHPTGFVRNTKAPPVPQVAYSGSPPASADLSAYNPPVGDQGNVNSCTAWATGYYMRGWYAKRDGYYPAGGFAPMYTYAQISQGMDNGSSFPDNLDIQHQQGLDSESDYTQGGYDFTTQPTDAERTNAARYKIAGYSDFNNYSDVEWFFQLWIKQTLAGGNPIAIAIPVYPEFDHVSAATNWIVGVPNDSETSSGLHAVFAYGYTPSGLLIENSWGTGWGNAGYGELSWEFVMKYGLEAVAASPQNAPGTWQQLPGGATDIAVGGNGAVWVLGTDPVYGGYGIYHWNPTTWTWNSLPGGAVRIAVAGDGNPWVVNSFGNIFRWAGTWGQLPGAARDIGVGADNSVWIVGANSVVTNQSAARASDGMSTDAELSANVTSCTVSALNPADGGIFRWTTHGWQQYPGGANRISVGADGNPWIVNSCGAISRWTGSAWQQMPGSAKDIGAGGLHVPGFSATTGWVLGTNAVGGGYETYRWNGTGWAAIDGGAIAIGVGPSGNAWVAANDGTIWEYAG